jgi:glutathione synthase
MLQERGQMFVGLELIGDYLAEVNVTSPTGLQEIDRFDDVNLEGRIWDAIERRLYDSHGRSE